MLDGLGNADVLVAGDDRTDAEEWLLSDWRLHLADRAGVRRGSRADPGARLLGVGEAGRVARPLQHRRVRASQQDGQLGVTPSDV